MILFPNSFTDEQPIEFLLPMAEVMRKSAEVEGWVFESKRAGYRFVAKLKDPRLKTLPYLELNEHTGKEGLEAIKAWLNEGKVVGLVADAGMPCVADPGSNLVRLCRKEGIAVDVVMGPIAMMAALVLSGLSGQRFHFEGYLPKEKEARGQRIAELYQRSKKEQLTVLCIEAPYRNEELLESLLAHLEGEATLSLGLDLTLPTQEVHTGLVKRFNRSLSVKNRPAIFLFSA